MTSFFTLLISVLIFSLSTNVLASDMGGFNVAANKILAGPTAGGNGTATYRFAVPADIPPLPYASSTLATGSFYIGVANVATARTGTQATAALDLFTAGLQGLAPASGGGAVNFLRADGTWATPAGSGTVTAVSVATANGFSGSSSGGATPALTIVASGCNGVCKSNGTALSTAAASDVTGQLLTGFSSGAGVVAGTDTILQGFNKLAGNQAGFLPTAGTGLVEAIAGHVVAPANYTYVLDQYAMYAYTINAVDVQTSAGTITAALKINGTNVTTCNGIAVTSTPGLTTCTAANTVAVGDQVTLVTSANAASADLSFTVKVTR